MQALRQILIVNNNRVNIELPSEFNADQVEVIILPFKENVKKVKGKISDRFRGCISKETGEEMQRQLTQMREEWERDIF